MFICQYCISFQLQRLGEERNSPLLTLCVCGFRSLGDPSQSFQLRRRCPYSDALDLAAFAFSATSTFSTSYASAPVASAALICSIVVPTSMPVSETQTSADS